MASITLKDVPMELREALKQRAVRNRRSLNQELLYCLEQFVGLIPASKADSQEWREASKIALLKVWDNPEDDIYNGLLKK